MREERWLQGLRTGLNPISWAYSAVMRLRAASYGSILPDWRPPAPCISVGNISSGGSGKTPLAEWILGCALRQGLMPALLTRGYRARPPRLPYLVRPHSPVIEAGDEPLMLSRSCSGALIVVDSRRDRAGEWVWQRYTPDLFVLDDGMQHLRVRRDLDLVLLTERDITRDWNAVLPSGPWREGAGALDRADAYVLYSSPQRFKSLVSHLLSKTGSPGRPIFSIYPEARGLKGLDGYSRTLPQGETYLLLSAVAEPARIHSTATQLIGYPPSRHFVFADHHLFTRNDWDRIKRAADSWNCKAIVCTPKDGVKLSWVDDSRICLIDWQLRFGPVSNTESDFADWLGNRLKRERQERGLSTQ